MTSNRNTVYIGDETFPVLEIRSQGSVVGGLLHICSLIVEPSFHPGGQGESSEIDGVEFLRHGANTYSLLSSDGGWIVSGGSIHTVCDVVQQGVIVVGRWL